MAASVFIRSVISIVHGIDERNNLIVSRTIRAVITAFLVSGDFLENASICFIRFLALWAAAFYCKAKQGNAHMVNSYKSNSLLRIVGLLAWPPAHKNHFC